MATIKLKIKITPIFIDTEFIRLDALLKLAGAASTGGQAKFEIQSGAVELDGEVCTLRGKKVRQGQKIKYDGRTYEVVSFSNKSALNTPLPPKPRTYDDKNISPADRAKDTRKDRKVISSHLTDLEGISENRACQSSTGIDSTAEQIAAQDTQYQARRYHSFSTKKKKGRKPAVSPYSKKPKPGQKRPDGKEAVK